MMTRIRVVCVLKAANYYYIWQKMRMTNDVCFILKGRSIYTTNHAGFLATIIPPTLASLLYSSCLLRYDTIFISIQILKTSPFERQIINQNSR